MMSERERRQAEEAYRTSLSQSCQVEWWWERRQAEAYRTFVP